MAPPRAVLVRRNASLSEPFGLDYATKLFGADVVAALPRYVRGVKAGKVKAFLIWRKAERGGWHQENGRGRVVRPGLLDAWIAPSAFSLRSEALRGPWLGRVQALAGPAVFLSAEGRAAEIQRQADERAEQLARFEEQAAVQEQIASNMRFVIEREGPECDPAIRERFTVAAAQADEAAASLRTVVSQMRESTR